MRDEKEKKIEKEKRRRKKGKGKNKRQKLIKNNEYEIQKLKLRNTIENKN